MHRFYLGVIAVVVASTVHFAQGAEPVKNRITEAINQKPPAVDISSGSIIPDEGYCDQPYVVGAGDRRVFRR